MDRKEEEVEESGRETAAAAITRPRCGVCQDFPSPIPVVHFWSK